MNKFTPLFAAVACMVFLAVGGVSQCTEPGAGMGLVERRFTVKSAGENILQIEASVPKASWQTKDAEGAVLSIIVDSQYQQDVMLFAGASKFTYSVMLGRLAKGKHEVRVNLNSVRSANNDLRVTLSSVRVLPAAPADPIGEIALANAPVLYLRPNTIGLFSDIPLFTYYEILPGEDGAKKIRYTTIFTNEDGGTRTAALMARWGRTTDIEWVYETEVKNGVVASGILQGANHVTKKFAGARMLGTHPVIYDVTDNNNFSDQGCSQIRTLLTPVRADLTDKSRETVMDANPWTYRIMAEEITREGRVDPAHMDINTIDDLRNYLYVEVGSENTAAAVAVEIETADGKKSVSDFGDARLGAERSGYKRIAVRLPSTEQVRALKLLCRGLSGGQGTCRNSRIVKFMRFGKSFEVTETKIGDGRGRDLKAGESFESRL